MIITETKSHDDIQFIHDNLYEFNLSKTGAKRQEIIMPDTPERTAFAVRDDDGKIFGGVVFYFKANDAQIPRHKTSYSRVPNFPSVLRPSRDLYI